MKKKSLSLAEFASEAGKHGMTYGQYSAYLYAQSAYKKRLKRTSKEKEAGGYQNEKRD